MSWCKINNTFVYQLDSIVHSSVHGRELGLGPRGPEFESNSSRITLRIKYYLQTFFCPLQGYLRAGLYHKEDS